MTIKDHINHIKQQMDPTNTLDIHNEEDLKSFKAAYNKAVEEGETAFYYNGVPISNMLFHLLYDSYERSIQQNPTTNN